MGPDDPVARWDSAYRRSKAEAELSTKWQGVDDSATRDELGVTYRDPSETFQAAIVALVDTGRLSVRAAGTAA